MQPVFVDETAPCRERDFVPDGPVQGVEEAGCEAEAGGADGVKVCEYLQLELVWEGG